MKRHQKIISFLLIIFITITIGGSPINAATTNQKMLVHYIDVGESDCVLIASNNKFMLIDAGDISDEATIINYLKKQKVKKLDYVIGTHPHADHIGAMPEVIKEFSVGKIIMPAKAHTTDIYEKLLSAIKMKGLKITRPVVGSSYEIGKAKFKIIAPNSYDYGDNLNNYSVGIRLTNGNNSFVFIGDNEKDAITDIISNKINLKSDVLMCGHHGSDTSTTLELLNAVNPKNAIISVGKNSYGHPNNDVLKMLKTKNITTFRTDENGTITATSTGKEITFDAKASNIKTISVEAIKKTSTSNISATLVYTTKTGRKYHRVSCSYLSKSKIKITLKKAKGEGLTPCSRCKPPK